MKRQDSGALDEADLIRRLQRQEERAFEEVIAKYKSEIYWIALRMVGAEDAEDITQEVFLRAYQAMPLFRGEASLRTWLSKIAYNLCISFIRRKGRRGEHVSLDELSNEHIFHLLPKKEINIAEGLVSGVIEKAMARLPARYRAILTLYYTEGLRYHEIAEVMRIPIGTVKTHLHRARLMLRDGVLEAVEKLDHYGINWEESK